MGCSRRGDDASEMLHLCNRSPSAPPTPLHPNLCHMLPGRPSSPMLGLHPGGQSGCGSLDARGALLSLLSLSAGSLQSGPVPRAMRGKPLETARRATLLWALQIWVTTLANHLTRLVLAYQPVKWG